MAKKKTYKKEELEVVAEVKEDVVKKNIEKKPVSRIFVEKAEKKVQPKLKAKPKVVEPEYKSLQEMTTDEYRFYLNTGKRPLK